MPDMHGRFCWYELMTADARAALAFYRAVLGWGARDAGQPGVDYTFLTQGDVPTAGLMALTPEMCEGGVSPGWVGYVAVDAIDEACARLTRGGGQVYRPPAEIPGVGRFAPVADPQGAGFILFQPDPASDWPQPRPTEPGGVGWRELRTSDPDAAFDFYAGQFGWARGEGYDMGEAGTYRILLAGGEMIAGMMKAPAGEGSGWLFYFTVEALDAAIERVQSQGGRTVGDPGPIPGGGWLVHCRDAEGCAFALSADVR